MDRIRPSLVVCDYRLFPFAKSRLGFGQTSETTRNASVTKEPSISLSSRQKTVLYLVAKGLQNKEIGDHLGLSVRTVKQYLSTLFAKFDVSNRTELLSSAIALGVIAV